MDELKMERECVPRNRTYKYIEMQLIILMETQIHSVVILS